MHIIPADKLQMPTCHFQVSRQPGHNLWLLRLLARRPVRARLVGEAVHAQQAVQGRQGLAQHVVHPPGGRPGEQFNRYL